MLKSIFIVSIGSFIGGAIRYIISTLMKTSCNTFLLWGTLTVNLLGCFTIGIIYALFSKYTSTLNSLFLLLTTGFCGGFSTFSTFANESLQMNIPADFVAQDIRQALFHLAEITGGEITTDEVLGNIFAHFCIGK